MTTALGYPDDGRGTGASPAPHQSAGPRSWAVALLRLLVRYLTCWAINSDQCPRCGSTGNDIEFMAGASAGDSLIAWCLSCGHSWDTSILGRGCC